MLFRSSENFCQSCGKCLFFQPRKPVEQPAVDFGHDGKQLRPDLVAFAGEESAVAICCAHTEALIGMLNVIPLVLEIVMGAFRPKLFGERRSLTNN